MSSPNPHADPSASPATGHQAAGGAHPSPATDGAAPAKKTRKLGDYELIKKLGQGAMGAVYLARNVPKDQLVALKILPPDLAKDQEFLERFRREARAATKISHTNVVAALDVGMAENYHFIAMEYVEGSDLETMLKKKGHFKEAELLRIATDVCAALEAADAKGIVHRDIKPANILMNTDRVCKLTDMGLASASAGDQRVTMAGFAVGTPYYLSPEQARGQLDVDARADIYSLGATLYHLATGGVPFPGNNPVVIMTQHINAPLKPPHEKEPSIPSHVSQLIMKMMAKDPLERPQNAKELLVDIERCKKGQAPASPKPPEKAAKRGAATVQQPQAPTSRNPMPAGAEPKSDLPKWMVPLIVGVVVLAVLIVAIVFFVLFKN